EHAYIVEEDAFVLVTRDGWLKRQTSYSGLAKLRIREQDEVGWLYHASTRSTLTVFTNLGSAYTLRVDAVPATTGYGDPMSAVFTLEDGERVVGVVSHDPRHRAADEPVAEDDPAGPYGVAVTLHGRGMRFPLDSLAEPSNKTGRKFARLDEGD